MKKTLLAGLFLASVTMWAQQLPTAQLPVPNQISENYINSLEGTNILYGKTPSNFNGKVILFSHGFMASSGSFLIANTMYEEAYKAGYKAAFVSTTRLGGDWVNGEILSRAIDQVCQFYNVSQVSIVAHSNGGKASEVALVKYNKNAKVDKVISLGTPFRGTQLADFSEYPLISWLSDALGTGTGAGLSTTYYCDTYFRPYFDNHPNNIKSKFYSFGAVGFSNWFRLSSAAMIASGSIVYTTGGGSNDGVTPFYSSIRPGSKQLFKPSDTQTDYNHMEVAIADNVWGSVIKPTLSVATPTNKMNSNFSQVSDFSNYKTSSNYQILSNDDGTSALISKNSNQVHIDVIKENPATELNIIDTNSKVALKLVRSSVGKQDANHSFNLQTQSKKINITGNDNYLAVLTDGTDEPMTYEVVNQSKGKQLQVKFPNTTSERLDQLKLTSKVFFINELEGGLKNKSKEVTLNFVRKGDTFFANISNLYEGIYSLKLIGEIPNEYKRSLITGFVVTSKDKSYVINDVASQDNTFKLSNNRIIENSNLIFSSPLNGLVSLKIINLSGRIVVEKNIQTKGETQLNIGSEFANKEKGVYLINVSYQGKTQTLKALN